MLRPGDAIGVIAPAGPVDEAELRPGIDVLESAGYRVHPGRHVFDRAGYLAGGDEARLADLHDMFRDRNIRAVFCARGGYGSPRLLDRIDYDLIRENPKILVGYSDITALLMAVHEKTGLVTFHGPMVRELASENQDIPMSLLRVLSSDQPLNLNLGKGISIVPGRGRGTLIGGNLSLLCHLIGTQYLPSFKGRILFVEEKGETVYRLDRMLTHLRLSGKLDGLSGLIAGGFEECGDMSEIEVLLKDTLSGLDIPAATGLPAGHGPENIVLPLGLTAELDTDAMTLSIAEGAVV